MDQEKMSQNGSASVKTIREFFERGIPIDIYLPDGWGAGRHDGQFALKSVSQRGAELIVDFGEGFCLPVSGDTGSVREIVTTVPEPSGPRRSSLPGFRSWRTARSPEHVGITKG
jgi:hypothetical protein